MKQPSLSEPLSPAAITASVIALLGVSVVFVVLSSKTVLLPFLLMGLIVLLLGAFFLRPNPTEIVFLMFPMVHPLIPAVTGFPKYHNWSAFAWVLTFLIMSYFCWCRRNMQQNWVKTHYGPFFIAYSLLLIISTFVNPMHPRALSYLMQTLPLIFVYWMLTQFLSLGNLNRMMNAILIGAVISGMVFFYAWYAEGHAKFTLAGFTYGFMRPVVLGIKANTWPMPSMIAWIVLLTLIVHQKIPRGHWVWLILAGLILHAVIVINMSRSIILGVSVSTVFIMMTHPRTRKLVFTGLVAMGTIGVLILPIIYGPLANLLRFNVGLTGRSQIWKMASNIISEHLFFGLGPANFMYRFINESPFMPNGLALNIDQPHTHNYYFQVTAELGVLGAVVVVGLIVYFFYRSWKLWPILKNTKEFTVLVAITAISVAYLSRSFFEAEYALQHGNLVKNILILVLCAFQDQLSAKASTDS